MKLWASVFDVLIPPLWLVPRDATSPSFSLISILCIMTSDFESSRRQNFNGYSVGAPRFSLSVLYFI